MSSQQTIWKAQPHTLAKIRIVEEYLKAWFPIIGRHTARIIYIDGFCGPGQYIDGEKGSPIAAIETALNHDRLKNTELVFLFIDKDKRRIDNLESIIRSYKLPDNYKVKCVAENFKGTLELILSDVNNRNKQLAPAFLFVDPFGIKEVSYELIRQYMSNKKCEVLVNIMIESINRFMVTPEFEPYLDELFGTDSWRNYLDRPRRIDDLIALYESQLKKVADYIWSFGMRDRRNKTKYILFFGTNHIRGLEKMKDAMWKVCPTGDYIFSDRSQGQMTLFDVFNPALLADTLKNLEANNYTINELERYVLVSTPYRKSHLRGALSILEDNNLITVQRPGQRGFPPGTIITIL